MKAHAIRPRMAGPKTLWLYWIALLFGVAFYLTFPIHMPHAATIALKGAGVTSLAIWAALNAQNRDGWAIAAVLALGALGDVLLELSQIAGAAAFLAGHLVAIWLYLAHRRAHPSPSQTGLVVALLIATPVTAFLLSRKPEVAIYAAALGAMAASAWLSRFPRYRVGLGAALFVASDLLIFAKMGPLAGSRLPSHLIWPLYLAGQALVAWGAVATLLRWRYDEELHHRL